MPAARGQEGQLLWAPYTASTKLPEGLVVITGCLCDLIVALTLNPCRGFSAFLTVPGQGHCCLLTSL